MYRASAIARGAAVFGSCKTAGCLLPCVLRSASRSRAWDNCPSHCGRRYRFCCFGNAGNSHPGDEVIAFVTDEQRELIDLVSCGKDDENELLWGSPDPGTVELYGRIEWCISVDPTWQLFYSPAQLTQCRGFAGDLAPFNTRVLLHLHKAVPMVHVMASCVSARPAAIRTSDCCQLWLCAAGRRCPRTQYPLDGKKRENARAPLAGSCVSASSAEPPSREIQEHIRY